MVARVRCDYRTLELSVSKMRILVGGHWDKGSQAKVQCIVHPAGSSHMVSAPQIQDLPAYACVYVMRMLISRAKAMLFVLPNLDFRPIQG